VLADFERGQGHCLHMKNEGWSEINGALIRQDCKKPMWIVAKGNNSRLGWMPGLCEGLAVYMVVLESLRDDSMLFCTIIYG
jgi:hypothetical protein